MNLFSVPPAPHLLLAQPACIMILERKIVLVNVLKSIVKLIYYIILGVFHGSVICAGVSTNDQNSQKKFEGLNRAGSFPNRAISITVSP